MKNTPLSDEELNQVLNHIWILERKVRYIHRGHTNNCRVTLLSEIISLELLLNKMKTLLNKEKE